MVRAHGYGDGPKMQDFLSSSVVFSIAGAALFGSFVYFVRDG